jgi:hypothetical protein
MAASSSWPTPDKIILIPATCSLTVVPLSFSSGDADGALVVLVSATGSIVMIAGATDGANVNAIIGDGIVLPSDGMSDGMSEALSS